MNDRVTMTSGHNVIWNQMLQLMVDYYVGLVIEQSNMTVVLPHPFCIKSILFCYKIALKK